MSGLDVLRVSPGVREGFLTLRAIEETWGAFPCTGICHRHIPMLGRVPSVAALAGLLGQNPSAAALPDADDADAGDEEEDENGSYGNADLGAEGESI